MDARDLSRHEAQIRRERMKDRRAKQTRNNRKAKQHPVCVDCGKHGAFTGHSDCPIPGAFHE